mgnify:CR=1 FL=1
MCDSTLNDFFNFLSGHPVYVVGFMVAIPILGAINGILADDRSPENPWRYIYMVLIYLISVPGIFAVTLLIYSFLFENRSVYDIDLVTQILPIISMFVTILVIKRYIDLDDVPGFGKLTGLIMMISVILILLWVMLDCLWMLSSIWVYLEKQTQIIGSPGLL